MSSRPWKSDHSAHSFIALTNSFTLMIYAHSSAPHYSCFSESSLMLECDAVIQQRETMLLLATVHPRQMMTHQWWVVSLDRSSAPTSVFSVSAADCRGVAGGPQTRGYCSPNHCPEHIAQQSFKWNIQALLTPCTLLLLAWHCFSSIRAIVTQGDFWLYLCT